MNRLLAAMLLLAGVNVAFAQAPAGAPAGSTGVCNDGTYSDAASKRGACAGHKGVKDWYAESKTAVAAPAVAPAPAAPAAKAPAAKAPAAPAAPMAPAPAAPTAAARPTMPTTPVAGGGNGQVWVNTASKVYHCEGSKYYGKTKAGAYMTESAAIAAGDHADHGKACKAG